ncbi:gamma-tubulin complex component 2-like isoform X2 [Ischnura elegans]|uniref:gamma-tubulin complex component 2-like isoform X2 n=1 Tax=Ischnura elegans TaxID=197161 RepID=UPI001ED8AF94|nr:gamma-tubulin complex component 2-like isoform X2 [Ischnura elegans]
MSDFKVHRLVKELVEVLGSSASPEKCMDIIQKNSSPYSSHPASQSAVRNIAQHSPNPAAFLSKYEELKSKNVDNIGSFVNLLARITEDKRLKSALEKHAASIAASVSEPSSEMTSTTASFDDQSSMKLVEDYALVRNRLKKVATSTETIKVSPFQKSIDSLSKNRPPNRPLPSVPNWWSERPYMTMDFVEDLSPNLSPLVGIPSTSQENYLLEDLLYCLSGITGNHIAPHNITDTHGSRTFFTTEGIDLPLKELVNRILPLASHYSLVARFIEEKSRFEYGVVNHALSAAMQNLLKDYLVFVAQLESEHHKGLLTLHKLWFYIQPSMRTMEILANIADTINKADARGGKVLSYLHEQTTGAMGEQGSQELCLYLTQAACVPYMEILEKWVYKGVINDPYEEFLVEDNEVIEMEELPLDYSDDYWEKRYTVRRERIPSFLEKVADVILRTGKYLNVIRQCGKVFKSPQAEEIVYTIKQRQYVEAIERAYLFASKTLLELLMTENNLMKRLRSVKHYFLLDQGDFIVQFMDLCEGELQKKIDEIVPTRLESLLELALRTSAANNDPFKDDICAELLPYDLMFQMFKILTIETTEEEEYRVQSQNFNLLGLESFSFGYNVKWPVSLVLNRKALACYQMIFRRLFYCKHVERLLCSVWLSNKVAKSFPLTASQTYGPAFALQQRMLNCVQNLEYYMMFEVIEPNWHEFLGNMEKVNNVDDVLLCHSNFLDTCLKDCMLTNSVLLSTVHKLLGVCVKFAEFIKVSTPSLHVLSGRNASTSASTSDSPAVERVVSESDSFEQSISRFDLEFTGMLVGLLDKIAELGRINNSEKLVNVLYRLDFNEFYGEQLQKLTAERYRLESKKGQTSG